MRRYTKNPNELYRNICQRWQDVLDSIDPTTKERLRKTMSMMEDSQIASNFVLLISMGEESICELLDIDNGLFALKQELPSSYAFLIIEEVREPDSVWYPLYRQGLFSNLLCAMSPMSLIPAGSFMMGASDSDENAREREKPQHKVTITKNFWMGKHPCTQELYEKVMGENPSRIEAPKETVERVSWCDAILFCNRLSEIVGLELAYILPKGFEEMVVNQSDNYNIDLDSLSQEVKWNRSANGYRLPTEAEWEYYAKKSKLDLFGLPSKEEEWVWDFGSSAAYKRSYEEKDVIDPSVDSVVELNERVLRYVEENRPPQRPRWRGHFGSFGLGGFGQRNPATFKFRVTGRTFRSPNSSYYTFRLCRNAT